MYNSLPLNCYLILGVAMSILNRCNPRLIQVEAPTGCTLTRASISAMTSQDFEDQALLEVGMDKLIAQSKELRMTGVKEKPLMDLLMSRMGAGKRAVMGQDQFNRSVIAPFSLVPQAHTVNTNYWEVEAGQANAGAGVGSVHEGAWDLTIINSGGPFATPLVDLEKYFLPGGYLVVMWKDTVTDVSYTANFKIIASVNADDGGVEKALVTVEPNYTSAAFALLDAGDQKPWQPTAGVAINLSNSISNYEAWCHQYPAVNNYKLKDFWWQTIRETWAYNDEYVKALNSELTSGFFKKFRSLPIAKQRAQHGEMAERDFFNTVFYGDRISEKQTDLLYKELPQVVDPADTDCVLEYKANTLGIRTQLSECGRVIDYQNAALDADSLKELFYAIRRHRGESGIASIDVMGDRFTYANFLYVMNTYYKARYGYDTTMFVQPNQKITFGEIVLWNYTKFIFPEDGFEINFIHDDYFDDRLSAFPTAQKSRGRALHVIDWSDIAISVSDARSVTRQTNTADDLYNCVIQPNVTHYQLQSKCVCVQVGDPNRHLMIENFSAACPTITATPCATS